jgi:hypothetical protein
VTRSVVRKGDRMGRPRGSFGPTPPAPPIVAENAARQFCPDCGFPIGAHGVEWDADRHATRVCPPPIPEVASWSGEWVADEGTLLRMLKRHYGWLQPEAGTLLRGARP